MALSLTEDVKTVTELKKNLRAVFAQVHRTGRPVVVTVKGKPDMVLVEAGVYERKLRSANLAALLAKGEEEIRQGKTMPFRKVLEELKRARKISR